MSITIHSMTPIREPMTPEEKRERWHCIIDHTIELMGAPDSALITPVLLERLAGYRDHGYPVGDFLQAVIANDLKDAIGRADEYNRSSLYHLVAWMYNEFPAPLWGSREKYSAHIERKRLEREQERQDANSTITIQAATESQS
jgi:hypothetical protein